MNAAVRAELRLAGAHVIQAAIHIGGAIRAADESGQDSQGLLMLHEALTMASEVLGEAEEQQRPTLSVVPDLEDQERAACACPWTNIHSCAGCSEVAR